ncbi:hypothetical protein R6Q57_016934 [Mikania cordata]
MHPELCNSYIKEARWFNSGYTPTLNEFLDNAYISIGALPIIKHAYLLTLTSVSKDSLLQIDELKSLFATHALATMRLTNDMGTSSDELERGDALLKWKQEDT